MQPGRVYYQWKEQGDLGELFTPHRDPMEYEGHFDLLFDTVEQAYQGLEDFGIVEEYYEGFDFDTGEVVDLPEGWTPPHWVLVRTSVELV